MRIAFIIAGTGHTYCGSCLRDHCYARELLAMGDDVLLLPAYLPPRFEHEHPPASHTVLLGGISVYLLASFPWARQLPAALLRGLNHPWILRVVGRRQQATDAGRLGQLAVEMLKGSRGGAAREFHLAAETVRRLKPDVVVLPNLMLVPLAPLLQECDTRVVVIAAGEEPFIDELGTDPAREVWHWISHWLPSVDAVITCSHYYAERIKQRTGTRSAFHVVPLPVGLPNQTPEKATADAPLRIAYFSRLVPQKGLDLLIEAVGQLRRSQPAPRLRLEIAGSGGLTPCARECFVQAGRLIGSENWEYVGELPTAEKWQFLARADLWALPSRTDDSQCLAALEAAGAGTPIVVPARGWYPELVEQLGGGVLFQPEQVEALAEAIAQLATQPSLRRTLGQRARETVCRRHAAPIATRAFRQALEQAVAKPARVSGPN